MDLEPDKVRELYLQKCTTEQHIELLENEIKLNEEKIAFYNNSRLFKDELKHKVMMERYKKHIEEKRNFITKLKKKL
ncbi:MAG: hypothetical protein B7Y83_00120 [Flavobacteriales bacterium 32-34-25]|nr:MAG: hypothetical protein B7Y83_00120 [Flavobacteriales bacterium 32-34-25]